jgi:hypothetical protein
MRRFFFTGLLALSLAAGARAETGLAFLTICTDGAGGAMGEVQVLDGGNALCGIANPALAPRGEKLHLALTWQDWLYDSQVQALSAAWRVGPLTLGLDLRTLDAGSFELRSGPNPAPEGEFAQSDLALGLRLAWSVTPWLSAGVALRRIQEKIYTEDSHGWVGDLGLAGSGPAPIAGPLDWRRWQAGLALRHLGTMSAFVNEAPELPRTLALAAGAEGLLPGLGWPQRLEIELRSLQDDGAHLHLGFETTPVAGFALRTGWMSGYSNRAWTAGMGFAWRGLALDWSWLPYSGELDQSTHRFTFAFAL